MAKLTQKRFKQILQEEVQKKLSELNIKSYPGQEGGDVLSKGLKVRHKKSGVLYTIISISPDEVLLQTPDDKTIQLSKDNLAKEYELD